MIRMNRVHSTDAARVAAMVMLLMIMRVLMLLQSCSCGGCIKRSRRIYRSTDGRMDGWMDDGRMAGAAAACITHVTGMGSEIVSILVDDLYARQFTLIFFSFFSPHGEYAV